MYRESQGKAQKLCYASYPSAGSIPADGKSGDERKKWETKAATQSHCFLVSFYIGMRYWKAADICSAAFGIGTFRAGKWDFRSTQSKKLE